MTWMSSRSDSDLDEEGFLALRIIPAPKSRRSTSRRLLLTRPGLPANRFRCRSYSDMEESDLVKRQIGQIVQSRLNLDVP